MKKYDRPGRPPIKTKKNILVGIDLDLFMAFPPNETRSDYINDSIREKMIRDDIPVSPISPRKRKQKRD
jgi:hypothetical protein